MSDEAREEKKKSRNITVDILKGVAAYLVVLGHFLTGKEEYHRLHNFIYSFHMPLFMFLAGYAAVVSYRSSVGKWKYLARRFVNIMVPYLFWAVCISVIEAGSFSKVDWHELMVNALINNRIYWFLPTLYGLIIGYVCYCAIREWIGNRREWNVVNERVRTGIDLVSCMCVVGMLTVLMFVTGYQVCRDIVGFTIPFFAAAMYVENKWVYALFHHRMTAIAALFIYLALIGRFDFDRASIATSLLRMILGMCAVVMLFQLTERMHIPKWLRGSLVICGRYSLMIYLSQRWILECSGLLDIQRFGTAGGLVWYCGIGILACIVCSVVSEGLSRLPIVRTLVLGKIKVW